MNNSTNQYDGQPLQRRESLVKPTWHNVCPGQVPPDTLDKLNKMGNGIHDGIGNGGGGGGSGPGNIITGNNNNQIHAKVSGNQRRQVELFDIFGKV